MILNLISVIDNINYTSRDMEITEDMESTINGWCSNRVEYIINGLDSSEKMEFNYVSSKIKLNGESREDREAYAHTNVNAVIEKEVREDIEYIPDAMISSEFIENRNNELGGEQRDKSSPGEIQRVDGDVLEAETEHCNKGLMGKKNLRTHMERSHEKFLKKPRCEMCDRVFPSEKSLNNHMKKHDPTIGEGEFQCDVCMIYLSQKFSVQRHKKAIHKEVILLEKENLREVNTFLKDNTPVISKGEIMEECEGDGEAFDLFKKMVNIIL
jgi:uncharacterized C2H2 Zn-finger protein